MKRTITALDAHLSSQKIKANQRREWLVGTKCTICDLSFVVWNMPQVLNVCFRDDEEVDTMDKRKETWPQWAKWHQRTVGVDKVEEFLSTAEALKRL